MQLQQNRGALAELGARIWAISADDPTRLRSFRDQEKIGYPILLDPGGATIQDWGILNVDDPKNRAIPHPTTIILEQGGRVRFAVINPNYKERPAAEDLLESLREEAPGD